MMIRIDRTKIVDIWRDQAFQMTIGYIVLAVMFAFIAIYKPQFRYLFLLVPVALFCAGVMAWVFVLNTDAIIVYSDDRNEAIRARQLDHARQTPDHILVERAQEVIVGLELTQADFSIGGGRTIHIPEVVAVTAGPPRGLHIRTLPGQTPDDFAAHAPAIAYNLGVPEVQVVPLGPSQIRLDLLPEASRAVDKAA